MVFKAGYKRLAKELIDIIWSYDNRYKLEFKNCVYELNQYFHKHRCMDTIKHETYLYSIYKNPHSCRTNNLQLYEYVLRRGKMCRKVQVDPDNLRCYKLKTHITN
jgi:hypothetical protein